MGQNDLDPRTIDLNLNVNLVIEKVYQVRVCCTGRETELRDNNSMSKKGFCISMQDSVGTRARFKRK